MLQRVIARIRLAGPVVSVILLAALSLIFVIPSLILLPQGIKLPVVAAFLALSAVTMTVVACIMAAARERSEEAAQSLRVRLDQVQRFADDLIESDTVFQNDLIEINTRLNQRIVRLLRLLEVSKRIVSTYNPETVDSR